MKTKAKGVFAQCPDGTWKIDTKIKVDGTFRHFKKSGYATLSSAKSDYERARTEFIENKQEHCSVVTFDDLLKKYMEMRNIVVDILTVVNDKSIYHVNMLPCFGGKLLKNVFEKNAFNLWYRNLVSDKRLSNNRKAAVISRIKDILKFAYMHKYIDAIIYQDCDVCLYPIKCSSKPKTERIAWTAAEQVAFFNVIDKQSVDYVMFHLFFFLGARLGEFLALMPRSFNRNTKKIIIDQQVRTITGEKQVLTDKLKTHNSYRSIKLNDYTANLLSEYIDTLGIKDDEYLFGSSRIYSMPRATFRWKLDKYTKMAGVRRNVPHGIRHTAATMLASACENAQDIEAAAKRLGHTPQMFLNIYGLHNTDACENELLARMKKNQA